MLKQILNRHHFPLLQNHSVSLRQLIGLRFSLIILLCALLIILQLKHTPFLWPAWAAIGGYILLLITTLLISPASARKTIGLQLLLETQLLAVYLFVTGGASNPIISYYLLLIVFAAYHSEQKIVWLIALLSSVNYALLTQYNLPLPMSEHGSHQMDFFNLHITGMWLIFLLSAAALAALLPPLVKEKIEKQQEVSRLREQQLKNEQLIGLATLAAGTAHEMGTPLMTMELLLADNPQALDAEDIALLHQQVNVCRDSLKKLAQAGRQSQEHNKTVNNNDWLNTLLQRWHLSQPDAQWVIGQQAESCQLNASPLLDQALLNLLENAAQAGRETIQISSKIVGVFCHIEIRQPDPKAFQALDNYQLLDSEKQHGLGLGLYLSNASVEQFSGQILLSGSPQEGSLCMLKLPIINC